MRFYCHAWKLLGICILFCPAGFAQTATGSISGVVQDESGAVVPNANVIIRNVETGISRSVTTDAGGRYRVQGLIPDNYEVQAQLTGFETSVRQGVQMTVGAELEINMVLRVGQVTQKTVVTAEAPLVDTLTGTVSGLVDDKAMRDLPLNGRSFDQLIALDSSAPVIRYAQAGQTLISGSYYVYSVNGSRGNSNLFLMDGTELLGAGSETTNPGGATGFNLGVEAIREFSVLTNNYSAAYGKRAGGIINTATRSGTNALHGAAFEFLRNSDLDARNFFDNTASPPPFKRNQFGGALGGPIRKDRTFFFGNYEGLRASLGETNLQTVPDDNARQGILPAAQGGNVGLSPQVKPFLILFPPANGQNFGDGTARSITNPILVSKQNFYLARIDHKISDKDFLFGRYNYSPGSQILTSSPDLYLTGSNVTTSSHVFTLEETRTYPTLVNTARLGYTRAWTFNDSTPTTLPPSSLVFIPGAKTVGEINFALQKTGGSSAGASITAQGSGTSEDRFFALNQFDYGDQVFHQHGPHSMQFGVDVQRIQLSGFNGANRWGLFDFTSLAGFLTGQAGDFLGPSPLGPGDATKAFRQTYAAAYFQDDYKLRPHFTLNLGLRWEFMAPPTDATNRISNYHAQDINGIPTIDSNPTIGSPFYNSHYFGFAPRIGFAWDPSGNGKMAVRGGGGLFYDQVQNEFRFFTGGNAPFYSFSDVSNPPFPFGFSGGAGTVPLPQADALDNHLAVPTTIQYNLSVERQITPNTSFRIGYVGSRSYHLLRQADINTAQYQVLPDGELFYPANAPRINPAVASSRFIRSDAVSHYNGLQVDFTQRFSHGLRTKISYTFAKNIDDASNLVTLQAQGQVTASMIPSNPGADLGLSALDLRNNLTVNLSYDLPGNKFSGVAGKLAGGWQVGTIVTLSNGMPFTAVTGFNRSLDQANSVTDRPDLVPGASTNPILGGPVHYYGVSGFTLPPPGFYGNLGRNTLIGPGLNEVDLDLVKETAISERLRLAFRAEFFNLLNRANFGLPLISVFNSNGTVKGSYGSISQTVTTSRQIQFGLKLLF